MLRTPHRRLLLPIVVLGVALHGCSSSNGAPTSKLMELPTGDNSGQALVSPGAYFDAAFGTPVELTIATPTVRLIHNHDESTMIWLEHDQGPGGEDTPTSREFLVVFTPQVGAVTPEELVKHGTDGCHATELIVPKPSKLLGHDAMGVEVKVPTGCPNLFTMKDGQSFAVGDDRVLRVTATVIDGNSVIVYADAPTTAWPTFSDEVDALTASLHLRS